MRKFCLLITALLSWTVMWAGSDTDYSAYHYRPHTAFNTWSGTATIVLQVLDGYNVNGNVEVAVFTRAQTPVLRGVAQYDSLNAVWWLTVHGDLSEPMEFHLWDRCRNEEKIVDQDWTFKVNGIEGTRHQPYKLYWNRPRSLYENSLQLNATVLRTENGNTWMVPVNLLNPKDKITAVSFDLTLPDGISIRYDDDYWIFKGSRTSAKMKTGPMNADVFNKPVVEFNDGVYRIGIEAMDADSAIGGTWGDILELYLTLDGTLDDGIYSVLINNVVLTLTDGRTAQTDDFMASLVVVGTDAIAWPIVTISGAVTQDFMDDITGNPDILCYDMTEAYLPDGCTFSPAAGNALLYVNPADSAKVISTCNIVCDGQCDSLVLAGDSPFLAADSFCAGVAVFTREFTGMGTICLPFAPSTDGFDYYDLAEEGETFLRFTKVASPRADTPYLYRKTGVSDTIKASNVTVLADGAGQQSIGGVWVMHGTYTSCVYEAADNVYAVTGGKLYRNTGTLTVPPFRAYFSREGASQVPAMDVIIDGVTAVGESVSGKETDGYSIFGWPVTDSFKGMVIKDGVKTLIR